MVYQILLTESRLVLVGTVVFDVSQVKWRLLTMGVEHRILYLNLNVRVVNKFVFVFLFHLTRITHVLSLPRPLHILSTASLLQQLLQIKPSGNPRLLSFLLVPIFEFGLVSTFLPFEILFEITVLIK